MPYSITREDAGRDVRAIRTALSCLRAVGVNTSVAVELDGLAYSIEEQLKPVIDEPTEFGSMVQARWIEAPDYIEPLPWVYTPWQGEHRWRSGDGLTAVWSDLSDVEVLRIGAGEESAFDDSSDYSTGYAKGADDTAAAIRARLRALRTVAITSERKDAIDSAIREVR